MEIIYARLIEFGIVLIVGALIYVISKTKSNAEFKKSEKEWIENSFEYNGARYSKKYFYIVNGKINHTL